MELLAVPLIVGLILLFRPYSWDDSPKLRTPSSAAIATKKQVRLKHLYPWGSPNARLFEDLGEAVVFYVETTGTPSPQKENVPCIAY